MGIFDFFKKKPKAEKNCETIQPAAETVHPDVEENAKKQDTPIAEKKPSLTLEEEYGKISLLGYKDGRWRELYPKIQELEDRGLAEASIALGQFTQMTDQDQGLYHFKKAAAAGLAEGAWSCAALLGHEYIADIEGDDAEWYKYCLQAANKGCCDAMNELANMYNRKSDYLGAFYWYQLAAYYGHPQGNAAVNAILNKWGSEGKPAIAEYINGVRPRDVENAVRIFKMMTGQEKLTPELIEEFMRLAMMDDNEFMGLFLGNFFEYVAHDDDNARLSYQLVAHNGSIMGMKCLGDMFAAGKGCVQDFQKAMDWYTGAAEYYEKTAAFVMGEYYRRSNPNLAAFWYAVSDRRGFEPAFDRIQQLVG